jgi:hypothetical protein
VLFPQNIHLYHLRTRSQKVRTAQAPHYRLRSLIKHQSASIYKGV